MGYGEKLKAYTETIMRDWEIEVRKKCTPARQKSHLALRDHLPQFLISLADCLALPEGIANTSEMIAQSEEHAKQRCEFVDYSLHDVIFEYSVLREVLSRVLFNESTSFHEPMVRVNKLIDRAITKAGEEFANLRESKLSHTLRLLEQSNRDLQQFATIAAHDLRSPIATISSYIGFLDEEISEKSPELRDSFNFIQSAAQRMLILTERLLAYSKLGREEPQFVTVELNLPVSDAISNLQSLIEETSAQILYRNLPKVYAEPVLLSQLFQNLIANGIKFRAAEKPIIRIGIAEENDDFCVVSVKDNGIGFDQEKSEEIFEPFKRLRPSAGLEGSGLGLSTCKRVIEIHGGRIWALSAGSGGSTFLFTLSKREGVRTDI